MDPGQIYNVLKIRATSNHCVYVSNLEADKGSEVLLMMPPNVQEQVVERVGAMETTPLAQVRVSG